VNCDSLRASSCAAPAPGRAPAGAALGRRGHLPHASLPHSLTPACRHSSDRPRRPDPRRSHGDQPSTSAAWLWQQGDWRHAHSLHVACPAARAASRTCHARAHTSTPNICLGCCERSPRPYIIRAHEVQRAAPLSRPASSWPHAQARAPGPAPRSAAPARAWAP